MIENQHPSLAALRQFIAIQEAGGIASAARKMNLTQPALSRNIKRLEDLVGTPLLERHTRGAELTHAGKSLFKHATRALLEIEHGLESARKSAGVARKELRIGAGVLFSYAVVHTVLPKFEDRFPGYKLTIDSIPFESIADSLKNRNVDICVHGIPNKENDALTTKSVLKGKRSILCAKTHPLAKLGRKVSAQDLNEFAFVVFPRVGHQMEDIDKIFFKHMMNPPRVSFETDGLTGALSILEKGKHLMYGSALLASPKVNSKLTTLQTKFDLGSYEIGFAYRKGFELDAGAKHFIRISSEALNDAAKRSNEANEI